MNSFNPQEQYGIGILANQARVQAQETIEKQMARRIAELEDKLGQVDGWKRELAELMAAIGAIAEVREATPST